MINKYFFIYKPFGMLSQFSSEENKRTLADLGFSFPKDVYPVGRLDEDSEGLLILTNDKTLNNKLLNPDFRHSRTYWVQVDGIITSEAIMALEKGVIIKPKNKDYLTLPATAKAMAQPEALPERNPPVRFRANIPTSWLSLTLQEGKNRQVRKMTARVGFPTLRLIRYSIEDLLLPELIPGKVWESNSEPLFKRLKIK